MSKKWYAEAGFTVADKPAQSPDINVIEGMWLWHKAGLEKRRPKTEGGFWKAVKEEWANIPDKAFVDRVTRLPDALKLIHERPAVLVSHVRKQS